MQILKSSEDYLEAMLMMQIKHGYIRSIDIANELGVTKPSVSYATKRLRENGYITMDKDGLITITPKGPGHRPEHVPAPSGDFRIPDQPRAWTRKSRARMPAKSSTTSPRKPSGRSAIILTINKAHNMIALAA